MINNNISKEHILKAIKEIDREGIPKNRKSYKYHLTFNDKFYPPKYILSLANRYANGDYLDASNFGGGKEANSYLKNLGFTIKGNKDFSESKVETIKPDKTFNDKKLKITTAVLKSKYQITNEKRLKLLETVLKKLDENIEILVLPAGYFDFYTSLSNGEFKTLEKKVTNLIQKFSSNTLVCLGIDANDGRDQLGVTFSKNKVIALARKFHPTKEEKNRIKIAESAFEKERDLERTFRLKNKNFFLAVCYDSFGIKHQKVKYENIDYVINLIHGFNPIGSGNSGEVYFAKHGMAGASKEWNCPVISSAVFFDRDIPERWPTAVSWNKGKISTQKWKYEDNPINPINEFSVNQDSESVVCRTFEL